MLNTALLFIIKWFISNVFPGVAEVFASPLWLQSILIRLDFPTFERPIKAYSTLPSFGHLDTVGELMVYSDLVISIFLFAKVQIIMEKQ